MLPISEGRKLQFLTVFAEQEARSHSATEALPHVLLGDSATLHPAKDPHTGFIVDIIYSTTLSHHILISEGLGGGVERRLLVQRDVEEQEEEQQEQRQELRQEQRQERRQEPLQRDWRRHHHHQERGGQPRRGSRWKRTWRSCRGNRYRERGARTS
jgi:hypothetical protein